MIRIPVVFKGKALMPMKASRVCKFIKQKKAKLKWNYKLRFHYLQLLVEPSGYELQDINLGIDPGSNFDGFSVVSEKVHHINFELVQRSKRGKTAIKSFKSRQASNRRVRRSRLRHRPIRFDSRTRNKLSPTIKANVDFRKWLITGICKYYPISKVIIEDVRFNHYANNKGKSFSHVEQGKTELYNWIKNQGLQLELYAGYNTKKLRVNTFGEDLKSSNKGESSFEAHCLDSFVIASNKGQMVDLDTGEILESEPYSTFDISKINKKVTFIEKIVKIRRSLTRTRALYKSKGTNPLGSSLFRYKKGGIKEALPNLKSNKFGKCRIKLSGDQSNHPKQWEYLNNGRATRYKANTARYGGTSLDGCKKFFQESEWLNRNIWSV